TVTNLAVAGQVIWHLDVVWVPAMGEYLALLATYPVGSSCVTRANFIARSTDGTRWVVHPAPVAAIGVHPALSDVVYRSTMLVEPDHGEVTFWLSGARYTSAGYDWRVVLLRRRFADLFPTSMAV